MTARIHPPTFSPVLPPLRAGWIGEGCPPVAGGVAERVPPAMCSILSKASATLADRGRRYTSRRSKVNVAGRSTDKRPSARPLRGQPQLLGDGLHGRGGRGLAHIPRQLALGGELAR